MITEWFIQLGVGIASWFVGLFPKSGPPQFVKDFPGLYQTMTTGAAQVGAWVDWAFVVPVVLASLAVFVITFGVKLVLKIAAFIPFFGGSG